MNDSHNNCETMNDNHNNEVAIDTNSNDLNTHNSILEINDKNQIEDKLLSREYSNIMLR